MKASVLLVSVFDLHYLMGTAEKTEHIVGHHELGLFEVEEMIAVMEEADMTVNDDADGLRKAQYVFAQIKTFEDIERVILRGQGLSYNTYRSYLTAVKQFYEFTDGLNPLQVTPAWIEMFHDYLVQKVDISTAHLRICGLKKFFAGIWRVVPFYSSPFEIMSETLNRKLNRSKGRYRTKQALTKAELKGLLAWLRKDRSIKGLENYAIVLTLSTSGLRASELCQLNWGDLYSEDGR